MRGHIRSVEKQDIPALKKVLDSSELFPSNLLDEMINDYLNNARSRDMWFTTIYDGEPISIGYCAPERMTQGTYNLYAIGVHKSHQGRGVGKKMMNYLENELKKGGNRILIVETSGKEDFKLTREFYLKCQYTQQGLIPEFYEPGDDKVIFWKKLI